MVADPQGAPFYLMRPTPPPRRRRTWTACAFHPDKPGHVAWNELHATDQAAAMAFYAGQLGWEKSDAMDMGPMGTYQMFKVGGTDQAIGGDDDQPEHAASDVALLFQRRRHRRRAGARSARTAAA